MSDISLKQKLDIALAVFNTMRLFALTRHRPLAGLVLLLSMIPIAVNLYLFRYGEDGKVDPLLGCQQHQNIPVPRSVFIKRSLLVQGRFNTRRLHSHPRYLVHSVEKTLNCPWREELSCHGSTPRRSVSVPRTIYFVLLLMMNVLHITFTFLSIFGTGGVSNMSAFTEPVTSVLVSRFLLDLQEAGRQRRRTDLDSSAISFFDSFDCSIGVLRRVSESHAFGELNSDPDSHREKELQACAQERRLGQDCETVAVAEK
ncbi:hypothetical protein C8Q80DRAFT_1275613 [Daedaleopsis nitida]|nr:hypothetical protein C8Q80DRAFT_1275613 [Daedaleopsis nitida]